MVPYSVSKTSQISLARGLAEITKGTKVTVKSILPGPTMTGGVRDYMRDFAKEHGIDNLEEAIKRYFAEHETTSLLQRFLDPREVANVTVFLCSPHASGINGVAQHVDGGIVRHI
jgi:NAD(P)-dependent dehydrogenase (short-subunit alcohol dehydrogenase family)